MADSGLATLAVSSEELPQSYGNGKKTTQSYAWYHQTPAARIDYQVDTIVTIRIAHNMPSHYNSMDDPASNLIKNLFTVHSQLTKD